MLEKRLADFLRIGRENDALSMKMQGLAHALLGERDPARLPGLLCAGLRRGFDVPFVVVRLWAEVNLPETSQGPVSASLQQWAEYDRAPAQERPSRTVLVRWLLHVTRPVLSPLLGSTLCRVTDLLSGIALFSLGAYAVASVGLAMMTGAPTPAIWTVLAVMAGLSLLKAVLRYAEQFLGHLAPKIGRASCRERV